MKLAFYACTFNSSNLIKPNREDILPIQTHNPITYSPTWQYLVELLNENTLYNISLLRQLPELEQEYVTHLLPLWCKVYYAFVQPWNWNPKMRFTWSLYKIWLKMFPNKFTKFSYCFLECVVVKSIQISYA